MASEAGKCNAAGIAFMISFLRLPPNPGSVSYSQTTLQVSRLADILLHCMKLSVIFAEWSPACLDLLQFMGFLPLNRFRRTQARRPFSVR
jgi:hypothetical protein